MSKERPLSAIVRQSANTSRLLGVDYVPVFRSGRHAVEVSAAVGVAGDVVGEVENAAPVADHARHVAHAAPAVSARAARPTVVSRAEGEGGRTGAAERVEEVDVKSEKARGKGGEGKERAATAAKGREEARTGDGEGAGEIVTVGDDGPLPHWNAAQISNWEKLEKIRRRYEEDAPHQHFVTDHHKIVFGDGDPCARLMFVGEAPGADEDRVGKPFVGRAGQLLERMIVAMGLSRAQVYITNVLKTRPPNNATPTMDEAKLCSPYLFDQIEVIAPTAIVTLGLPATRLILGTDQNMSALRGRWAEFRYKGVTTPVMPTYHPAYLLRSYTKENREKVWSDLQKAMERLGLRRTPGETAGEA